MHPLSDKLYISAQVTPADLAEAAALGINTLICNRPDGEETDQPTFATVSAWAQAAGIKHVLSQAVTMPTLTQADAERFAAAVAAADTPVLAYCRTGTRCSMLWSMAAVAQGTPIAQVLQQTAQAGIDLSTQQARLSAIATA